MRGVAVRGWRAVLAVITCVAITMSGLISVSTPTPAHADAVVVTFKANGGSFPDNSSSKTLTPDQTGLVSASQISGMGTPTHPDSDGHHMSFTKWTSNADGTGSVINQGSGVSSSDGDIHTWYAQYFPDDLKITLDAGSGKFATTYPNQGATVESDPSTYEITASTNGTIDGSRISAIPEAFRKDPDNSDQVQVSVRWNTKQDGSGINLPSEGNIQIDKNVTYYPQWEQASKLVINSTNRADQQDINLGYYSSLHVWSNNVPGKISSTQVVLYGRKGDKRDLSPYFNGLLSSYPFSSNPTNSPFLGFVNVDASCYIGAQHMTYCDFSNKPSARTDNLPVKTYADSYRLFLNHDELFAFYNDRFVSTDNWFYADPSFVNVWWESKHNNQLIVADPSASPNVTYRWHTTAAPLGPCSSYGVDGQNRLISNRYFQCVIPIDLNTLNPIWFGRNFIGWANVKQDSRNQWTDDDLNQILFSPRETKLWRRYYTSNPTNNVKNSQLYAWYGSTLRLKANGGEFRRGITTGSVMRGVTEKMVASDQNGFISKTSVDAIDTPVRDGYSFVSWNSSATGNGTDFPESGLTTSANVTYYAKWRRHPVMTFNANGGNISGLSTVQIASDSASKVTAAQMATVIPSRTRTRADGKILEFINWNNKPDGSGVTLDTSHDRTLSQDETWYAYYRLLRYSVTFDGNGGKIRALSTASSSSPRWSNLLGTSYTATEDEDHPFTAGLSDSSNSVDLTTNSLGGTYGVVWDSSSGGSDTSVYRVFRGWSLTHHTPGDSVPDSDMVTLPTTSSGTVWLPSARTGVTLYAVWSVLRFDLNDRDHSRRRPAVFDVNANPEYFPLAHRAGYTFTGWLRNNNSQSTACFETCSTNTQTGTWYAQWAPLDYIVEFLDADRTGYYLAPNATATYDPDSDYIQVVTPRKNQISFPENSQYYGHDGQFHYFTEAFAPYYLTGWGDYDPSPERPGGSYTPDRWPEYEATWTRHLVKSVSPGDTIRLSPRSIDYSVKHADGYYYDNSGNRARSASNYRQLYALWQLRVTHLPSTGGSTLLIALLLSMLVLSGVFIVKRSSFGIVTCHHHGRHAA